jgi:hypothetical protein
MHIVSIMQGLCHSHLPLLSRNQVDFADLSFDQYHDEHLGKAVYGLNNKEDIQDILLAASGWAQHNMLRHHIALQQQWPRMAVWRGVTSGTSSAARGAGTWTQRNREV